jgi:subtilase-type serine protease
MMLKTATQRRAFTAKPLIAALAAAAALTSFPALSQNWLGGTGDWSDPGNWDAQPGPANNAFINSGTANLSTSEAIQNLYMGSATLNLATTGPGALTANYFSLGNTSGDITVVNIAAGSSLEASSNGFLGSFAGAQATIRLTGTDATLRQVSGRLVIGAQGTGVVQASGGALLDQRTVVIGEGGAANGSVTLSDVGTRMIADTILLGGDASATPSNNLRGVLVVESGAQLTTDTLEISNLANANGNLTVRGAGSLLKVNTNLGTYDGRGTATIQNGARLEAARTAIAETTGGNFALIIAGANTTAEIEDLSVGGRGVGSVNVNGTASLRSESAVIGRLNGGNGTAQVAGANTSWNNTNEVTVGQSTGATGFVMIAGGATGSTGSMVLGQDAGATGNMTITGLVSDYVVDPSTRYTVNGTLEIAREGTARVIVVMDAGLKADEVVLAREAGSTGTLVVGGVATMQNGVAKGGTLDIGTVRFGDGDGTLLFNFRDASTTLGADIEGKGTIRLMNGHVILTGKGDKDTTTTVTGGKLTANGALAGDVSIGSGATLAGSGSVGTTTLASGATLAPGNSIGTLTVNGDLTFAPGSVYEVEATPDAETSDRVVVHGIARLAGSVVHVGPDGNFVPNLRYGILSADSIEGSFDSATSNYAFLDPTLSYTDTDVTLTLLQTREFETGGITPNQISTANALGTLAENSVLRNYIATLAKGDTQAAFDSLSGEVHATVSNALLQSANQLRDTPLGKLRANLQAGTRAGAPTAQAGGAVSASALPTSNAYPAWAELIGNWQTLDSDGNAAKTQHRSGGLMVGADRDVGAGWRVGGALGYTDGNTRIDGRASRADVSSYSALVYGGRAIPAAQGSWNVLVGAGYTWHDISTRRHALSQSDALKASYGASTSQVFSELSYAWPLSARNTLEPYAGLSYTDLRTRDFSESGGPAALSGASESSRQIATTLGLRASQAFETATRQGRVFGSLGWRHTFGDVTPDARLAFAGSERFHVAGAPIDRDAALLELGANVSVARNATLGLRYAGQYASEHRAHAAHVDVRWRF